MNNYEKNMKKIIEVLIDNEKYITLEYLSQQLGISKRSVQNYIYKIQSWLPEVGLNKTRIIKKQGSGIKMLPDAVDKGKLIKYINGDKAVVLDEESNRRLDILKMLIFSNDELTIQFLADQFYISRTVILRDLKWVSQWLSRFNLQLFKCQRRGIGIVGTEVCRRNAIAGFFDIYKTTGKEFIADSNSSDRASEEKYSKLKSIYPDIGIEPICNIVEEAEKKFDFFLMDDYFLSLVTHLTISIARLKSGKNVDKDFMPPEGDYEGLERKTAEYISARIESRYGLKMPDSEVIYICMHLMGCSTFNYANDKLKYIPKRIEQLAIGLIDFVDNQLGTSFASDKILFFGIIFHLKASIYRLEDNISINTFSRDEFPCEYCEILNAVSMAGDLYKKIYGLNPNEEEIISIAMHFVLSQKRNTQKKRALLVCNNGVIAGHKLSQLLCRSCPEIDIVDICSNFQLTYKSENDFDFIISTVPLDECKKPIADLSPIAANDYTKFLDEFVFSL